MTANWYMTSLRFSDIAEPFFRLRRCHYLIMASDHDLAYGKATELGNHVTKAGTTFAGVDDLLLIHDPPKDGSELLWSKLELTAGELTSEIRQKNQLQAFLFRPRRGSGWYLARTVLCEIHDEGSHGDSLLVWINSYLIEARTAEVAYDRAVQIGQGQQDSPGSHLCNGDKAHWEFKGFQDILALRESPADGALLWCDKINTAGSPKTRAPQKSELSVFRWEAEQKRKLR